MSRPITKAKGRLTSAVAAGSSTISFQSTDSNRALTSVAMADFGTYGYLTINPTGKTDNYEVVRFESWSVSSSIITIGTLTRNLELEGNDTAQTGRAFPAGTTVIISTNHHVFNNVVRTEDAQTIAGAKTFTGIATLADNSTLTTSAAPVADAEIANKKYIDDIAIAGSPDMTLTVKGIAELATDAEASAGTATGGTGANLVVAASSCNETAAATKIPVGDSGGKIGSDWGGSASTLATLDGSSLVVENPASATATPTATKIPISDASGKLDGWISNSMPFGGDGSDGALDTSGGTVDIDAGGARYVVRNYTTITVASNALTFSNTHANGTIFIIKSQGNCTISDTINLDGDGSAGGAGGAGGASGSDGTPISNWEVITQDGLEIEGQNGVNNGAGGAGGVKQFSPYIHNISVALKPGSGGGGGGGGSATAGGAGGAGGGALLIECGGALNFTGTITADGVTGSAGTAGSNGGGGGGGGAGGNVLVLYNTLTSKSGTITITGGNGGAGGSGSNVNSGGSGGGGAGSDVSSGGAGGAAASGPASSGTAASIGGSGGAAGSGDAAGGGGGGGASGWYSVLPFVDPETT